jgi:hypothetical protein|tara:strand:- start:1830 stop:2906 length:1077 start_codon:yes stop_codon:yes gene_type:complete
MTVFGNNNHQPLVTFKSEKTTVVNEQFTDAQNPSTATENGMAVYPDPATGIVPNTPCEIGVICWNKYQNRYQTNSKSAASGAGGFKSTDIGMKVVCNDADCPPNHMAITSTDGKGDETCTCVENPAAPVVEIELTFWEKVGKLFGVTKTFNAFSDESTIRGEMNQMASRGIDIPAWSFVKMDDSQMSEIPVETFERTFVVPFGTITQTKKVQHPDPANQLGDTNAWRGGKPMFDIKVRSELTPTEGDDTPSSTIEQKVEDPFMPSNAQWELSGLDTWFDNNEQVATTTTTEEEDEDEDEEPEPADTTKAGGSNTGLYIIGGVGVLAAGYLYFIIRNPKAYVQATAIRTGGGLVSQMLG